MLAEAEKSLSNLVKDLVDSSLTKPSKSFGELVLEVDHKLLGLKMLEFRKALHVKAIDVAEILEVERCEICFLEKGKRMWNLEKLKKYIVAVGRLAKAQDKLSKLQNKLLKANGG